MFALRPPDDLGGVWRTIGGAFRVRFGGGAVGRLGQITIWGATLIAIVAIIAILRQPDFTPWMLGGLLLFLLSGLGAALIYSLRYPQWAALGDAQMERVIRQDQAVKGLRDPALLPTAAAIPTDNPLLIESSAENRLDG